MMVAISKGSLKAARYFTHFGINPHEVDVRDRTLLHNAVRTRDGLNLATLCIEIGVPLDSKDENGKTAAHLTISDGEEYSWIGYSVLEKLFEEGANAKVKDVNGLTVLHYAFGLSP